MVILKVRVDGWVGILETEKANSEQANSEKVLNPARDEDNLLSKFSISNDASVKDSTVKKEDSTPPANEAAGSHTDS